MLDTPLVVHPLHRQRLPAAAPQAVQILATCHGLAEAGASVHLLADLPLEGPPPTVARLLADHGLDPVAGLEISWLTQRHRTLAGLEYRGRFLTGLRRSIREGAAPVVFSRRVDYAADFLRWRDRLGLPIKLVYEWHYVASANEAAAGHQKRARAYERAERVVLAEADGHVTISHALRDYLLRHFSPRSPVVVIPNGGPSLGDGDAWRGPFAGGVGPQTIVYAGLFRRVGDLEPLLQAAQYLPPGVQIQVVGADDGGRVFEAVKALVAGLERPAAVQLLGYVPPDAVRRLLTQASLAVATFEDTLDRRHFGCPLKILEYQAVGTPLVCTDHRTIRELVTEGDTGVLVDASNPRALAAAMVGILADPVLALRLSEGARALARTRTWAIRGRRLLDFIEGEALGGLRLEA